MSSAFMAPTAWYVLCTVTWKQLELTYFAVVMIGPERFVKWDHVVAIDRPLHLMLSLHHQGCSQPWDY